VVSCQDERSQLKNRNKAMRVLRSRLMELELQKREVALSQTRKSQVGTGERSEKIRTYNFKENRITDHRLNISIYQLPAILEGGEGLDSLMTSLLSWDDRRKIESAD
jgi:peptide chain release factor 1